MKLQIFKAPKNVEKYRKLYENILGAPFDVLNKLCNIVSKKCREAQ